MKDWTKEPNIDTRCAEAWNICVRMGWIDYFLMGEVDCVRERDPEQGENSWRGMPDTLGGVATALTKLAKRATDLQAALIAERGAKDEA